MTNSRLTWLDRFLVSVTPSYGLRRIESKEAVRSYEAAGGGRRTSGWTRVSTDANSAASSLQLSKLRNSSRDLRRNNGWARRGIRVISANTVGWGIQAKSVAASKKVADESLEHWNSWAKSTNCDFDGRLSFAGIQRLAIETIAESGEVLIVKETAKKSDGLSIPLRIRVLEPEYIDTSKHGKNGDNTVFEGIEIDSAGRRVAYWLYNQHPGAADFGVSYSTESNRVEASSIIHVFRVDRPGQRRGVPWLAPAIAKLHELNDFDDARLMQAKIAACFGAFVTDIDGRGSKLGSQEGTDEDDRLETLEPGHIEYLSPGKNITFPNTPSLSDHGGFSETQLRYIAASIDVPYEELTTDYSKVNFSSARMARLSHWSAVHDWRWNMLIPQLCDGVWAWAMELSQGFYGWPERPTAEWSAPPMPMLAPEKEGLAYTRLIRSGVMTLSQAIQERGEDPKSHLAEIAADNAALDKLSIVLDSDPRQTSGAGVAQPGEKDNS